MRIYSSLLQLAALGALSAAGAAVAAEVDTSAWKCKTCPYPKGTQVSVEAGIGTVTDESSRFGDYTGLQRKEAHAILGGTVSHRSGSGYYAELSAADLGLDTRSLSAVSGLEGLYSLRLGYSELPRHLTDGAQAPFLGNGGADLTLPAGAGFPTGSTATMPLATTLQPLDVGYKRQRFDLAGKLTLGDNWTWRVSVRRDVRDGSQPTYGSFFASAAQLAAPLDQTTDWIEVSASYVARGMHATLAYQLSEFKNGAAALNWDNPFVPVVPGATRGQLALAPDNQLQQFSGSAGYEITPTIKASADFAVGRLTQDAALLQPTLNGNLTVPALAAQTLDGEVETFNGSVRLTAAPMEGLRLNASYARDVRDNNSAVQSWPVIDADLFVQAQQRSNSPFGFTQDRYKLVADYRGPDTWKFSGGAEQDNKKRTYAEVVETRETTLWGRVAVQPMDELTLSARLAHAERDHSGYGQAVWFGAPQNPLLRKFNLAERSRDSLGLRADWALSETLALGLALNYADDAYGESLIGLQSARSFGAAVDLSWALSEQTRITAFVHNENLRSRQRGSEAFAAPDWTARAKDQFDVLGVGVKHAAIVDKLDIGADLSVSRSRSEILMANVVAETGFPVAKTAQDTLRLYGSYKLQDNLWLNASWWYERYDAQDWRLDGVAPATVQNLLSFGQQAPQYSVNVLRVSVRYRF